MNINYGSHVTELGSGIDIRLNADEIATAIMNYLSLKNIKIHGHKDIYVNGEPCKSVIVCIDPSGSMQLGSTIVPS